MNTNSPVIPLGLPARIRACLLCCCALLGALLGGLQPATAQTGVPPDVAANAHQWPLPHRDYAATRAALDAGISSRNVARLALAWSLPIKSSAPRQWGIAACNPLILDDIVYFQNLQSDMQAVELATGAIKWERRFNQGTLGPNGVAVAWGKVFGEIGSSSYSALDLAAGTPVWSIRPGSARSEKMLVPPIPYDGALYLGTDGNSAGVTGRIYAFDPETQEELWSFATDESGNAWGNRGINFGAGIWMPLTVDTRRDLIYVGVGNVYPYPGTSSLPNGSSRPGPNLYSNSMLALDRRTGELKWFNQVAPHDLFDHDFHISPVLATVRIDGADRDIVIGAGKMGRVIAFDRDTGEKLWDTPVGTHLNDDLTELPPGETLVIPGAFGGVVTPIAYAEGVVFAPVANRGDRFTPTALLTQATGVPPLDGDLTALDAATGEILWNAHFDSMALGGATVVNDLVFTATLDGMIYALDRWTGEERWKYQAPGGINAWPAVANNTIVWPIGMGQSQLLALRLPPPPPAEWVRVQTDPASTPRARHNHAMVYDEVREVILMHGGRLQDETVLSDTWQWDGRTWTQHATDGPKVFQHSMVYDPSRGVTVLYGGRTAAGHANPIGDTWEWDGQSWSLIEVGPTTPPPRVMGGMAYDPIRQKVVRQGGITAPNDTFDVGATWEWDGQSWTQIADGFIRGAHSLLFDPVRGKMIAFGGSSTSNSSPSPGTWEFDGDQWNLITTEGPSARFVFNRAFVWDVFRNVGVLFGGVANPSLWFDDTWEWDGVQWKQMNAPGPGPRGMHALAYDVKRRKVVLFGGFRDCVRCEINETWEYGLPPLQLTVSASRPDGSLEIRWTGEAPPYQLQSRASLSAGDWQNEGAPTDALSVTVPTDSAATFFRVLSLFGDPQ